MGTATAFSEANVNSSTSPPKWRAKHSRAFGRLPHAAARDPALDAPALVMLAYRLCAADDRRAWGMNASDLAKIAKGPGVGREAGRRAIAANRAAGYIDRPTREMDSAKAASLPHPRKPTIGGNTRKPDGRWSYGRDTLTVKVLSDAGHSRHLLKSWFELPRDRRLTVKGWAVFLYLRAGTGKGPAMARDIEKRFGWTRPTVLKVMRELIDRGLVTTYAIKGTRGQFDRQVYEPVVINRDLMPIKKPGNGQPGNGQPSNGKSSNTRSFTFPSPDSLSRELPHPHSQVREDPTRIFQKAMYASRGDAPTVEDLKAIKEEAVWNSKILGWDPSREELDCYVSELYDIASSLAPGDYEFIGDADLEVLVRKAAGNRIAPDLLTPAGLFGLRCLAKFHERDGERSPTTAMRLLLEDIWSRWGSQTKGDCDWLNSWKALGDRLFGETYSGGRDNVFAKPRGSTQPQSLGQQRVRQGSASKGRPLSREESRKVQVAMKVIKQADRNKLVAKDCYKPAPSRHLLGILNDWQPDALERILTILHRENMLGSAEDGAIKVPGSIKTWTYFSEAFIDEAQKQSRGRQANGHA